MKTKTVGLISVTLLEMISWAGCDSQAVVAAGNTTVVVDTPANVVANAQTSTPIQPLVCDPFANDPTHLGSDQLHGVVASLKYLPQPGPIYTSVTDMQTYGAPVDATLFLSDINIPTRSFSLGFSTAAGDVLKNAQGNTLYEYFSVHMDSQIQLNASNPVGAYQFGVISDDGSITQIDTGTGFTTLLNNDGTHSSRFTGSSTPVQFSTINTIYPIKIDYFQGPRYHIAMVLLWRPWPQTGSAVDPQEGKSGNSLFFDSTTVPSTPTATYNSLLTNGWTPVAATNFVLPKSVAQNPCQAASVALQTSISGASPSAAVTNSTTMTLAFVSSSPAATFSCSLDGGSATACTSPLTYSALADGTHQFFVYSVVNGQSDPTGANYSWSVDTTVPIIQSPSVTSTGNSFTVAWTTNKPTTSQVNWGAGASTGTASPVNSAWVTSHSVTISGLNVSTVYSYTFGGTDQAGNTVTSAINRVRTAAQ
jgi:hypothetical protein